jgi:hypothetical protein
MMPESAGGPSSQILDKVEKVWQDQNALAYFASLSVGKKKSFITKAIVLKLVFVVKQWIKKDRAFFSLQAF